MTITPESPGVERERVKLGRKRTTAVGRVPRPHVRSRAVQALTALVGVSVIAHVIASFSRATVVCFPDEYIYSELSRSFSSSGLPYVRGSLIGFPSLLQPLLTAPAWLFGSVEAGFRTSMVLGSVAMSLAALPVYWLGRRLGLSGWLSVAVAALTLATPSMLYSSWLMGEPVAYPLFVTGFALGVLVLSGERRLLWPLLAVFVLGALARVQLLVLPLAFALTSVLFAARERRLRRFLRERRYLIAGLVAVAVVALVVPSGAFGFYRGARNVDLYPTHLASHFATQLLAVLFASSWIVVPGALIGLWLSLKEPRSRLESAFACSALVVTLALVLQTALWGVVENPQERYLFYSVPLLALALALLVQRGWPFKRLHALLVCPLFVLAAVLPLSTYAAGDRLYQSSFLLATYRLEQSFGVANGSLLAAVAVSIFAALALALPFLPRFGGAGVLVSAILFSAFVLGLATDFDTTQSAFALNSYAPAKSWVDGRLGDGQDAVLLQGFGTRAAALEELFWNRSVNRVGLLPDFLRPDDLSWPKLEVAGDGSLSIGGKPLRDPLLIDSAMQTVELRGAVRAGRSPTFTLWRLRGTPRFALYALGLVPGWMGPRGSLTIWPEKAGAGLSGYVSLRVRAIGAIGSNTLYLTLPGLGKQSIGLPVGQTRLIRIPVCSAGSWRAKFRAHRGQTVGDRLVSARSTLPLWENDPGTCGGSQRARVSVS